MMTWMGTEALEIEHRVLTTERGISMVHEARRATHLPQGDCRIAIQREYTTEELRNVQEENAIAQLAYQLWQKRGCPIGSPEVDWFRAAKELARVLIHPREYRLSESRIETLTQAQLLRIPEFVERWTGIGLSTARTDRSAAERAVRRCYERTGIKAPEKFIWLKSPLAGALAYILLAYWKDVRRAGGVDSVRVNISKSVPASVRHSIEASVRTSFWSSIQGSIGEIVDSFPASITCTKVSLAASGTAAR
jgi:hypothetical protein